MNRLPVALIALSLAACGTPQGTADTAANGTAQPAGVDYVQQMRTMPVGQRNAVLLRAIRDAGRECQGVTEATEVTAAGGPSAWSARCDSGSRWVVSIAPDGTATVVDQASLRGNG